MKEKIKREFLQFRTLLKCVPVPVTAAFIAAVIAMNLLANKSIDTSVSWLALDCGITVSWFVFFVMDILTKRFGPKASTEFSVLGIVVNLFFCLLLLSGSFIPGSWGEAYGENGAEINGALDATFRGSWYVVLGSTVAFFVSAVVNNVLNYGVGKLFKKRPDGLAAYVCRAYISTAVGQFCDNIIFALIVSRIFFGWSYLQCVTCAATGMVFELLCEGIFFYPGFAITRRWQKEGVGNEYLKLSGEGEDESNNNGNV